MTKEQEEVINKLRKITNRQILYGNKFGITIEGFRELQEDLETVLNMLKEKDREIEELKQALSRNITNNFISSMKESAKSKEDLEMLDKGWQIVLERKENQIDLMSEQLAGLTIWNNEKEEPVILGDKEEVKKYYERKATKMSQEGKSEE